MSAAAAMAITPKTVLVVEDDNAVRTPLVTALEFRGFQAKGAANVMETRKWVDKLGQQIDVAVLDMRLQDHDYPQLTGADLGQEVRSSNRGVPPEFLIFSGFPEANFYEQALRLGSAAYLIKATVSQEDLIRHIRSLALRRALNPEREDVGEKVEQIVEKVHTHTDAIKGLCRSVIEPELTACLSVPAVFLLSNNSGTQNCGAGAALPAGYSSVYEFIQDLTFGALNSSGPFVFSQKEHQHSRLDPQAQALLQRMDGACFLPIHAGNDMRLSIGLLQSRDDEASLNEEPTELAGILNSYLRAPVHELLNYLVRVETAVEKAKRKTLLEHTSRFCLYVGQTQLDVLNEAATKKEVEPSKDYFQKLKRLALDLQATGNEFSQLSGAVTPTEVSGHVSVSSVVQQAIDEIEGQFLLERLKLVEKNPEESFDLAIEQNDLFVAVLRVLQWMAQREDKTPPEVTEPKIEVFYRRDGENLEIHFTDQSRRLGPQLRRKMFEPFTQAGSPIASNKEEGDELPGLYLPLYLAKMLVEVKNSGSLKDRSDELESTYGHCFVMSFPEGEEPPATPDTA